MTAPRVAAFAVAVLLSASTVSAQVYLGSPAPRSGSVEIGGGVLWIGGVDLGERTAELSRNSDPAAGPFDLFSAESQLKAAAGFQARLGYYLSPNVSVEGGLRIAKPVLSIGLSGDAESAADETAEETLNQYIFDGSLVLHMTGISFAGGNGIPFVFGGAGYVRELHQGNELIETGTEFHGGAGVNIWFGSGQRRLGLRGDLMISSRKGGFDFEEKRRVVPVASASLVYLF